VDTLPWFGSSLFSSSGQAHVGKLLNGDHKPLCPGRLHFLQDWQVYLVLRYGSGGASQKNLPSHPVKKKKNYYIYIETT